MSKAEIRLLNRLARSYGVETAFRDSRGERRHAGRHSLLAALRALGAPVEGLAGVPDALRERVQSEWRRLSEPVAVSWGGRPVLLELRLPAAIKKGPAAFRLELEGGRALRWTRSLSRLPLVRTVPVEGAGYEVRQLALPTGLPPGYHLLTLELPELPGGAHKVLIISAPLRAFTPPPGTPGPSWGVFLPLYSLHSGRSWGAGDFTDLEALLDWVRGLGGDLAGTLPLLAAFLDEPFAPGPYEPVSRLFWNEFYLDLARVEELKVEPKAQELLNSPGCQDEIAALRAAPLVDYRRGTALKRRVLELCAQKFFAGDSRRQAGLRRWAAEDPAASDYARFRAAVEQRRAGWTAWPGPMRDGVLRDGDFDPEAERYHLYVQWLAREQLGELSARAGQKGRGLYLDLPLGVHREGYDVWRERSSFALEAGSGAPPDSFFTRGQDWGFPPLHPERIREQGYRYIIACLRSHLRHAAALRLDHVMGLSHLFWIPEGLPAKDGVYVRYRPEEFYAVLTLESQRSRALLIGEDLGTVPGYVRAAMDRHKVHRMYVLPFELTGEPGRTMRPVPANALACLNTHDMEPFAAWLKKEKENGRRASLPLFLHRRGGLKVPTSNARALMRASLSHLAASRAGVLLVNLEDLWLETSPQNVPGTGGENPNWRRKARYSLDEFSQRQEVLETLQEVNLLRSAGKIRPPGTGMPPQAAVESEGYSHELQPGPRGSIPR
ncbi:MAG: 4-alpha-glucanotransferase [Eubacteriales bacterium]